MQHKHEKDVPVPREGDNNFLEIIKKKKNPQNIHTGASKWCHLDQVLTLVLTP